jgi:L-lactate dehydrogenase complex protein LldG
MAEAAQKIMSASRETILSRVRGALHPLPKRAAYPEYPDTAATMPALDRDGDSWAAFSARQKLVNGTPLSGAAALAAWLTEKKQLQGYCDPALWPQFSAVLTPAAGFKVETTYDRTRVDDFQFGITAAAGAIAETGSLILTDASTASRLGALAPWVHVAVLRRAQIFPDVAAAVAALGDDPNIIWCTGPSKTADVEGILIEGVHGPGTQIALLLE